MATSWTNSIKCTINGMDVTDCLLKMSVSGTQSNVIGSDTLPSGWSSLGQ